METFTTLLYMAGSLCFLAASSINLYMKYHK